MIQVFSQMSLVLFGFFGFSALISKSAFTIFYSIAVIFGLFKFKWNIILQLHWLEKFMILLFPLAVVVSIFSVGGPATAFEVFTRWTWPLIYFPIKYLSENKDQRHIFFKGLAASLFIACLYSYDRFYIKYNFDFSSSSRAASFWDLLRWAYFCSVAVTILFSIIIRKNFLSKNMWKLAILLFVMSLISLILTGSRGAWIGAILGMFVALISQRKSIKYYLGYGLLVAIIMLASPGVRQRISSSFNVQRQGDQITSEDKSNAGRLHMWKVTGDLYKEVPLFGVGFQNSKPALEEFLSRQSSDYIQKYTTVEYSYNDQHSSYLTLLLQFGGIFFLVLYSFFFLVTYLGRRDQIYFPAIIGTYAVYFFYSAIVSFEAVVMFAMMAFMILNLRKKSRE